MTTVLVSEPPSGMGSVLLFTGTDEETGDTVTFGVDHRVAAHLAEVIEAEGEIPCEVEGWQIMRRLKATS